MSTRPLCPTGTRNSALFLRAASSHCAMHFALPLLAQHSLLTTTPLRACLENMVMGVGSLLSIQSASLFVCNQLSPRTSGFRRARWLLRVVHAHTLPVLSGGSTIHSGP